MALTIPELRLLSVKQCMHVMAQFPFRTVVIRTPVALFSHRCRIALLAFAHLTFALLSHSHCWPFRTVVIRTVGFALVSFALLSFALLSYKRAKRQQCEWDKNAKVKCAKVRSANAILGRSDKTPNWFKSSEAAASAFRMEFFFSLSLSVSLFLSRVIR